MGVLEEKKFKEAMRTVTACARERFRVDEELLKDARKQLDRSKSPAIAYPRELILPELGRSKDDDTQDSSITYCVNEKVRGDPNLRKYGVQLGYMTEREGEKVIRLITFKDVDWDSWEEKRKQKEE